jgi:hypothetical protein
MKEVSDSTDPTLPRSSQLNQIKVWQRLLQFIGGISIICTLFVICWPYRTQWGWPYRGEEDETTFFACLRLFGSLGSILNCFLMLSGGQAFSLDPSIAWIVYLAPFNCFFFNELGLMIPLSAFVDIVSQFEAASNKHQLVHIQPYPPFENSPLSKPHLGMIGTSAAYTLYFLVNMVFRPTIIFFSWYIASYDHWSERNLRFPDAVKLVGLSIWDFLVKLIATSINFIHRIVYAPRPMSDLPYTQTGFM